ncbi:MAG TPA: winged helix-turn-helix domain-containing protein [Rhizomicrobium sp.]|jgi:DNA-binding winged helix-turn-helix (wHTH) protein/tetratricopeptide (TPR) repeat protein|nr:winged helix-turn-helix domain-containing protein [Rhizomicrobium sp.]
MAGFDLGQEADFRLGGLLISPSTCRARTKSEEVHVEPRTMEVLLALTRANGGTVTREQLVSLCWQGRSVSDDAISRAVAKARQLTRIGGETHFEIETLPKIGFRLLVRTEEPTPADDNATSEKPPAPPEVPASPAAGQANNFRRWTVALAAAAAVLLIAGIAGTQMLGTPQMRNGEVALLSFQTAGADPVLKSLSMQTRNAISTAMTAAHLAVDASEANDTSGSEFDLGGAIARKGEKYVVTVSISNGRPRAIVWSGHFERAQTHLAGFDEEIAARVSNTLKCATDERRKAIPQLNDTQLSLLLASCDAVLSDYDYAVDVTRQLVTAAPGLSGAYALRAIALADRTGGIENFDKEAEAFSRDAERAAAKAIALDPDSARAHLALGLRLSSQARFAEREKNLVRALELDPSLPLAKFSYMGMLREVGRLKAAAEVLERIDGETTQNFPDVRPLSALFHASLGNLSSARRQIDFLDERMPDLSPSTWWTAQFWWDDPHRLDANFWLRSRDVMPANTIACTRKYLQSLLRLGAQHPVGLPPECATFSLDWQARLLSREGDVNGAYAVLEGRELKSRTTMFLFYPEMKAFRADPRFMALAERFGLVDYWRATHQWPDFCASEKLPYRCH